ncbi:MAG TPA: HAD-IA family hydrolase [Blastocatellia bacterium]|nr:HAD-IA family hydrolase [Blastocatellia bacterium]
MLFDLDGTLIDTLGDLTGSLNLMLSDLGRPPLSKETVASIIGNGIPVTVHRCLTVTHPNQEPPGEKLHAEGIRLMHEHYADEMLKTTALYPNVVETLEHFKHKRKAVVTSKEARFAHLMLDHFAIARHFDVIVGGDTVPARKPDPWPVREAINRLEGPASDAVMIGDSENDVIAGRGAGAKSCAACYGYRSAEQLAETSPDAMIHRFDELEELFR